MAEAADPHPLRATLGMSAALATPFTEEGEVDWPRLAEHALGLIAGGMKAVTIFGTTGEGPSVPAPVRRDLYGRLELRGLKPELVIECVFGTAAEEVGAHARQSFAEGCAGVLLAPPIFFKDPSPDGLYDWFAAAIDAMGQQARNLVLYNIPQLTGVRIAPELVTRLREAFGPAIGGIKDSSADWAQTEALIAAHADLAILVGHEGDLARAVRAGASGAISGVANFAPALVARLVAGQDDARIGPLLEAILALPVVPAVKAALASVKGDDAWRRVRPPLRQLTKSEAAIIARAVEVLAQA